MNAAKQAKMLLRMTEQANQQNARQVAAVAEVREIPAPPASRDGLQKKINALKVIFYIQVACVIGAALMVVIGWAYLAAVLW